MKALEIKDLHKTYRNGVQALSGVNLTVAQGDFFALLGPNGAGKSTTIGIICSLVTKSTGKVLINGISIDDDPAQARSQIGLVPQEFNFNVFEPIGEILINQAGYYGIDRKTAATRAEKYLRQLELWDKRFTIARDLSGGMKRRLMIARALVHEPSLLILDEPTAGVDIEIRHSMWQFLRDINAAGTTIILTTHYLEEAETLCDNIAIIDHGITVEQTGMRDLLERLHVETFILYLDAAVQELPQIGDFTVRLIDDSSIEVDIHAHQDMNMLYHEIAQLGLKVTSMKNKSNRLEQLFINMVNADREVSA